MDSSWFIPSGLFQVKGSPAIVTQWDCITTRYLSSVFTAWTILTSSSFSGIALLEVTESYRALELLIVLHFWPAWQQQSISKTGLLSMHARSLPVLFAILGTFTGVPVEYISTGVPLGVEGPCTGASQGT